MFLIKATVQFALAIIPYSFDKKLHKKTASPCLRQKFTKKATSRINSRKIRQEIETLPLAQDDQHMACQKRQRQDEMPTEPDLVAPKTFTHHRHCFQILLHHFLCISSSRGKSENRIPNKKILPWKSGRLAR